MVWLIKIVKQAKQQERQEKFDLEFSQTDIYMYTVQTYTCTLYIVQGSFRHACGGF